MNDSTNAAHFSHRLKALERRQRWLMMLILFGVSASILAAMRPASQDDAQPLRVRHVQLIDAENRVRGEWKLEDGHPTFTLLDTNGKRRLVLIHDEAQTGLFALDDEETVRLGAAQFAHGGGGFALHGSKSKGAAVLYLKGDGSLTMYDAEGNAAHRWPEMMKNDRESMD